MWAAINKNKRSSQMSSRNNYQSPRHADRVIMDPAEAKPLLKPNNSDVESGSTAKEHSEQHHAYFGIPAVLVSGIFYALSSGCLTLLNKYALAGFGFTAPNALLCFQCALTVVLVKAVELLGLIKPLQPLKWDLIRVW